MEDVRIFKKTNKDWIDRSSARSLGPFFISGIQSSSEDWGLLRGHSSLNATPLADETIRMAKKIVFAMGWRRMFRESLFIHTLNGDEDKYVKAFGFGAPTEIIPNGVYPEVLLPVNPNPFFKKYPALKNKPYILFLSRLHRQKGIVRLLDGFERFAKNYPDVQLVLAGPDYGELPIIKETLQKMKAAHCVHLTGPIYGDEKVGALHGASCFALTSLNEGFSVAILEALACGLPVIISEQCYFPEVQINEAGFISLLDPISISKALTQILADSTQHALCSENAKHMINEHYLWSNLGLQIVNLYETYIDKPTSTPQHLDR